YDRVKVIYFLYRQEVGRFQAGWTDRVGGTSEPERGRQRGCNAFEGRRQPGGAVGAHTDGSSGSSDYEQSIAADGGKPGSGDAGELSVPGEDQPLRSRADPRAGCARARVRLLR